MNILIFEYITGGGMIDEALPPSLCGEGDLMLAAAAKDFNAIKAVKIMILRDYRLENILTDSKEITIKPGESYSKKITAIKDDIDYLMLIAPESGGLLASLCREFSKQGINLLNSKASGVELTSDKYKTYMYLNKINIQQAPTVLANNVDDIGDASKYIVKPIDGAGCEDITICKNREEILKHLRNKDACKYIVQHFIKGAHASLSLLAWNGVCHVLACNKQKIIEENCTLKLIRCEVNVFDKQNFQSFSDELISALPDLFGYIGVDIILDGNEIYLIEINPRLTTSYVGIGDALGINPAKLILKCFQNKKLPDLHINKNNTVCVTLEADCAA